MLTLVALGRGQISHFGSVCILGGYRCSFFEERKNDRMCARYVWGVSFGIDVKRGTAGMGDAALA